MGLDKKKLNDDMAGNQPMDYPLGNWLHLECLEVFPRSVLRNTQGNIFSANL